MSAAPLLVAAHNVIRSAHGLLAYLWSEPLARAAQEHAEQMARRGVLAHDGIGDGEPWERIAAAGYGWSRCAENAAAGQPSEDEVMAAWMADPGHRGAILGPYRDLGAGVATGADGTRYWVVDFASPIEI